MIFFGHKIHFSMNYNSLGSPDALVATVFSGVNREWLEHTGPSGIPEPTRFLTEVEKTLRCLYVMSKGSTANFVPAPSKVLEVFKLIRPQDVKVVITAQDPYPRMDQATGIAFHATGRYCPQSARQINANLIKYGHIPPQYAESSNYISWVKQGVLLINVSLTTEESRARAHSVVWKDVIAMALQLVPKKSVAVLLGADARSAFASLASLQKVEHCHPASRQGEFLEMDVFGNTNAALIKLDLAPINWTPC